MRVSLARILAAFSVLLAFSAPAQAEEEKVLNIYNWSDYVAEDTIEKFTAETGIKVNYDVYDSDEVLSAKLQAGRSGYDVVFPSNAFLAQQVKMGVYQKLDRSKLKNYGNLDPKVLKTLAEAADPDNAHAIPYMIAATGIGYNIDKVKAVFPDAPLDSWALLFKPEVVAKLKSCGVSLLDTPTEVFPAALSYLGKNGASQSSEDMKEAAKVVSAVRPSIRYFHSSKYINDLANGDVCVAHGHVGDLVQARDRANEADRGVRIGIIIPKEGAELNIDSAAIPADAPHPGNAHLFLDFLMRPDIIADITNTTGYANAIPAATAFTDPEIAEDVAIYPPEEVRAKEFLLPPATQAFERERTRTWTRVKTGK